MLAACRTDAPTAPLPGAGVVPGPDRPAQSVGSVPFTEEYRSHGTIGPSASCPQGTLLVVLDGSGTATHVGRYTITNSHCLDLATGAFTNGTFVKTAANGDQLYGTYSGLGTVIVAPAPVGRFQIAGTLTFTGGTGRFAGVSGTAEMSGVQTTDFSQPDFPTDVILRMKGRISTVGSAR
jgi:hypothetical protein